MFGKKQQQPRVTRGHPAQNMRGFARWDKHYHISAPYPAMRGSSGLARPSCYFP